MAEEHGEDEESEHRTLVSVFNGPRARPALAALSAPSNSRTLTIDGSGVCKIDSYGGAVLGLAARAHTQRGSDNQIILVEPVQDVPWMTMYDLLGNGMLPERCRWAATRSAGARGEDVLIPATSIADDGDVDLIAQEALPRATGALGFGATAARFMQEAAVTFLDNALTHGDAAPIPPVLCSALDPQGNDLQLVVVDLGTSAPADAETTLRDAVGLSRANLGGIQSLVQPRRDDQDISIRLAYGAARAHYRTGRSWTFTSGTAIPGFIAGAEIHR